MLIVLAASSRNTSGYSAQRGYQSRRLPARPLPVTRPMRAQTSCAVTISGYENSIVHSIA